MCSGNKKETFDVNILFTATLAYTKGHFTSQKRALLVFWKKRAPCAPGFLCPCSGREMGKVDMDHCLVIS
jgi:hypothetical protein